MASPRTAARLRGPRAWLGAFAGFYPGAATDLSRADPLTRLLYSSRVVILVVSAQAAVIAGLLAATDRRLTPLPFGCLIVGYVVLHAVSNLTNDYFGYRRGHDTPDSPRRRYTLHPLATGAVSPRFLLTTVALLLGVAALIGAYFVWLRGWGAVVLIVAGAALLYGYDAAPRALKELGFGELATFTVWGPLMIGGGYFALTGVWSGQALLVAVPYGLGIGGMLVAKHIDQIDFDAAHGQRTAAVLLGESTARRVCQGLLIAMYAETGAAMALGALSWCAAVVLFAAPRGVAAVRRLASPAPAEPPAGYVGWPLWFHRAFLTHDRLFGWLLILGLTLGAIWPATRVPT